MLYRKNGISSGDVRAALAASDAGDPKMLNKILRALDHEGSPRPTWLDPHELLKFIGGPLLAPFTSSARIVLDNRELCITSPDDHLARYFFSARWRADQQAAPSTLVARDNYQILHRITERGESLTPRALYAELSAQTPPPCILPHSLVHCIRWLFAQDQPMGELRILDTSAELELAFPAIVLGASYRHVCPHPAATEIAQTYKLGEERFAKTEDGGENGFDLAYGGAELLPRLCIGGVLVSREKQGSGYTPFCTIQCDGVRLYCYRRSCA